MNTDYEARAANLEISMIMQRAVCIALKDFDSLGLFLSYRSKVHILFLVWNKPPIFMGVDFSYCLKNQYRDNYIRFNLFIFNLWYWRERSKLICFQTTPINLPPSFSFGAAVSWVADASDSKGKWSRTHLFSHIIPPKPPSPLLPLMMHVKCNLQWIPIQIKSLMELKLFRSLQFPIWYFSIRTLKSNLTWCCWAITNHIQIGRKPWNNLPSRINSSLIEYLHLAPNKTNVYSRSFNTRLQELQTTCIRWIS